MKSFAFLIFIFSFNSVMFACFYRFSEQKAVLNFENFAA